MDYAKIHMLKSDLQFDGIRGGALERQLCCQCGALINGIRALTRREKKKTQHSFCSVRIQLEIRSLQSQREISPEPEHAGSLISDFQSPEL